MTQLPAHEANDDLDRILGQIVRASATLDMTMRDLGRQLVMPGKYGEWHPTPEESRVLGQGGVRPLRQFSELLDLVSGYASTSAGVDELTVDRLRRLVVRARLAYEARNRAVHDPPLGIHPDELTPGGPTHKSIRLDIPTPMADVSFDELAGLAGELWLLSHLTTSLSARVMARNLELMTGKPHPLDLEKPYIDAWSIFDSLPPRTRR